jgi:hypothetical protein
MLLKKGTKTEPMARISYQPNQLKPERPSNCFLGYDYDPKFCDRTNCSFRHECEKENERFRKPYKFF